MNKPSSTITAATLAGMGMTMGWQLVMYLNLIPAPPPSMIAASVTFVSALVGYFKKENVLK